MMKFDSMQRTCKLAFLALGLFLIAAHPPTDKGQPTPAVAAEQSRSAELPADAGAEVNRPCKPGVDQRSSDLCAQWKAADAADTSALWAFWTWIAGLAGLGIGGGTLFAAWRAAHWAKLAAIHTEAGAAQSERSAKAAEDALEQAKFTSRTDLRAWVSVEAQLLEYKRTTDHAHFTIEISLANIGKTQHSKLP